MSITPAEPIVSLPENIVLGGINYSVRETPELLAFMVQVSKVEKNKLYSQFESLRSQIAQLQNVKIEAPQTPLDADALANMKKELMQELGLSIKDAVREVVQPVLNATAKSAQEELDAYRLQLVKENDSVCIPELVKGNTKEELEASLKESIRLRGAYPSPSTPFPNNPISDPLIAAQLAALQNPTPTPVPSLAAPVIPAMPSMSQIPAPEVAPAVIPSSMSMDEFASRRGSIMQELQATYGGGSN